MTIVALAAKRGIKRHCQSEPCGLPFYDLNRSPIECPNCGEGYVPVPEVTYKAKDYGKKPYYKLFKPVEQAPEPEEKSDAVADDALETTADDGDEIDKVDTLLEIDEDDGGDAIDTGVKKDDVE